MFRPRVLNSSSWRSISLRGNWGGQNRQLWCYSIFWKWNRYNEDCVTRLCFSFYHSVRIQGVRRSYTVEIMLRVETLSSNNRTIAHDLPPTSRGTQSGVTPYQQSSCGHYHLLKVCERDVHLQLHYKVMTLMPRSSVGALNVFLLCETCHLPPRNCFFRLYRIIYRTVIQFLSPKRS